MERTVWCSFRSRASCASTMMLFTPNWSMKLIISFCAPAVMESMATTAPTPRIMPNMVSRLRSLCAKRLESPIISSGKTPLSIGMLFSSPAAGRHPTHGVAAAALLGVLFLAPYPGERIGEGYDFVGLDAARQDHGGLASAGDFD